MKIEVIIPVAQYDMAMDLLEMIDKNITVPSDVHVIDNTGKTHFWMVPNNYNLHFHSSTTGRMNESWEIARAKLSPDTDFVTFLNDDIIIGKWFFRRVLDTFDIHRTIGIVVPHLVPTPEEVAPGPVKYEKPPHWILEASAFTIRKDVLDNIPPVPWERVTTFYGDNWMWKYTREQNYCIMEDIGNCMYHHVGVTVKERGFRSIKKKEFNEWRKIRNEIWGI